MFLNLKGHLALPILSLLLVACSPSADKEATQKDPEAPVHWRMSSTYPSSLPMLGALGKQLEGDIKQISNGSINIKFHEPGALAPPLEGFDAVSYGAIEASWSTPGYWAGKVPALQLFSSVPFGPDAPEYLAWFYHGGGRELFEEIYHKQNIHGLVCGLTPPEAAGWYTFEINTPEDFIGKKIRFFGLGGSVLEKLGANAQLLAGGDILPALELGTIDGAEYSMPSVDHDMGFYQAAKYYYFPGWHQQSTFFELIINLKAWNGISDTQRQQIEVMCEANVLRSLAEGEATQVEAIAKLKAKGVEFRTFSPEVLDALEAAWNEVVVELAADDEDFNRAWTSLSTFRTKYTGWRDLGYLERE